MNKIKLIIFTLILTTLTGNSKVLPLEDFTKPAEFLSIKISPDGTKMVGVIKEEDRDKVAVIDIKTMEPLSAKEFGENRIIRGVTWANNDVI
ncbi:MAG TPA: hypothetical protein ENJ44_07720, partial [Oceanospirillales bacterium]|nr:hypothetical protein [Oceanospirillales bacterium]